MVHIAIATSYPTPATFDAGRQPFSYIPSNTTQSKTKKSVTGIKHIGDDGFCPQATSTPRKTPSIRTKASEASDDDIPLALVMRLHSPSLSRNPSTVNASCPQDTSTPPKTPFIRTKASEASDDDIPLGLVMRLRSASLSRKPSTVKRPMPIRRQAVEVDDDEDLPLIEVKERMKKFNSRPMVKHVIRRQPPTKNLPLIKIKEKTMFNVPPMVKRAICRQPLTKNVPLIEINEMTMKFNVRPMAKRIVRRQPLTKNLPLIEVDEMTMKKFNVHPMVKRVVHRQPPTKSLPLIEVDEMMMKKFNVRPIIKRVVRRQPSTNPKVVQTVRDLGPTSTPMVCVVPDCPYDWHVHVNTVSH